MATEIQRIAEQGVLTLPDAAWERARQRMDVVGPLAALEVVVHQAADAAAHSLGLSRWQVYVLIWRARQGSGLVTDLARGQSSGGKGKGRLSESVELIIRDLLQKRFLIRQKRSLAALYREIIQMCKAQKLRVPARNTVALRITTLDPIKTARSRGGPAAACDLQGVGGVPPEVTAPLEQVQLDNTVIDRIIVDERDRQPTGRPYLTIAIDVFTLWEQRQALARLRQLGREQVDEAALFRMIRQMRDIVDTAQHTTRKTRRDTDRWQHLKTLSPSGRPAPPVADIPDAQTEGQPPAAPFDHIEEW